MKLIRLLIVTTFIVHACGLNNSNQSIHGGWTVHEVYGIQEFIEGDRVLGGLKVEINLGNREMLFFSYRSVVASAKFQILEQDSILEIYNSKLTKLNGKYYYKLIQDKKSEYSSSYPETLYLDSDEVFLKFGRHTVKHKLN